MEKDILKQSNGILCSRNEVKYSFITQHKNTYPISLGVHRSGYYNYQTNVANKPDDPERQEMLECVKDIAENSDYSYGSRRIKKALNALSIPVNRNKAGKLMRDGRTGYRPVAAINSR